MNDKKVKDKHIRLTPPDTYLAVVIYYQDKPERDGHKPVTQTFWSLHDAKDWLKGFPRDVWDGGSINDHNYVEIDERGKRARKRSKERNSFDPENRRVEGENQCFGRSLAGSMRIRG